jgi:hypothetical protein
MVLSEWPQRAREKPSALLFGISTIMQSTPFIVNDFLKVAEKRAQIDNAEIRQVIWGVELACEKSTSLFALQLSGESSRFPAEIFTFKPYEGMLSL